jgi:hypothetical protein
MKVPVWVTASILAESLDLHDQPEDGLCFRLPPPCGRVDPKNPARGGAGAWVEGDCATEPPCAMIRVAAILHQARTGIRAFLFVIKSRLSRDASEQWLA